MDTWDRLTDLRGEECWGLEEIRTKEHMYGCKEHSPWTQC